MSYIGILITLTFYHSVASHQFQQREQENRPEFPIKQIPFVDKSKSQFLNQLIIVFFFDSNGRSNNVPVMPHSRLEKLPMLPPSFAKKSKNKKPKNNQPPPPLPDLCQRIPLQKVMSRRQKLLNSGNCLKMKYFQPFDFKVIGQNIGN